MKFADAIVAVTTGGTRVALGVKADHFDWIYVMAHDDNDGVVHIGGATVVSAVDITARGILVPQQFASAAAAFVPLRLDGPGSLADIFVDAVNDGDAITWFGRLTG